VNPLIFGEAVGPICSHVEALFIHSIAAPTAMATMDHNIILIRQKEETVSMRMLGCYSFPLT
jgi:hypothetical protein